MLAFYVCLCVCMCVWNATVWSLGKLCTLNLINVAFVSIEEKSLKIGKTGKTPNKANNTKGPTLAEIYGNRLVILWIYCCYFRLSWKPKSKPKSKSNSQIQIQIQFEIGIEIEIEVEIKFEFQLKVGMGCEQPLSASSFG